MGPNVVLEIIHITYTQNHTTFIHQTYQQLRSTTHSYLSFNDHIGVSLDPLQEGARTGEHRGPVAFASQSQTERNDTNLDGLSVAGNGHWTTRVTLKQ